jgi:hypothetical protein
MLCHQNPGPASYHLFCHTISTAQKEALNNHAVTDVSEEPAASMFKAEWLGSLFERCQLNQS